MKKKSCCRCGKKEQVKEENELRLIIENREVVLKLNAMCLDCFKDFLNEIEKPKGINEPKEITRLRGFPLKQDFHSYLVGLLPVVKGKKSLEDLKFLIEKHTGIKVGPDIIEWKKWFEEEGHKHSHAMAERRSRFHSTVCFMRMSKDKKQKEEIAKILEKCTGQNFRTNADMWEKWMDENPDSITEELDRKLIKEANKVKGLWFG